MLRSKNADERFRLELLTTPITPGRAFHLNLLVNDAWVASPANLESRSSNSSSKEDTPHPGSQLRLRFRGTFKDIALSRTLRGARVPRPTPENVSEILRSSSAAPKKAPEPLMTRRKQNAPDEMLMRAERARITSRNVPVANMLESFLKRSSRDDKSPMDLSEGSPVLKAIAEAHEMLEKSSVLKLRRTLQTASDESDDCEPSKDRGLTRPICYSPSITIPMLACGREKSGPSSFRCYRIKGFLPSSLPPSYKGTAVAFDYRFEVSIADQPSEETVFEYPVQVTASTQSLVPSSDLIREVFTYLDPTPFVVPPPPIYPPMPSSILSRSSMLLHSALGGGVGAARQPPVRIPLGILETPSSALENTMSESSDGWSFLEWSMNVVGVTLGNMRRRMCKCPFGLVYLMDRDISLCDRILRDKHHFEYLLGSQGLRRPPKAEFFSFPPPRFSTQLNSNLEGLRRLWWRFDDLGGARKSSSQKQFLCSAEALRAEELELHSAVYTMRVNGRQVGEMTIQPVENLSDGENALLFPVCRDRSQDIGSKIGAYQDLQTAPLFSLTHLFVKAGSVLQMSWKLKLLLAEIQVRLLSVETILQAPLGCLELSYWSEERDFQARKTQQKRLMVAKHSGVFKPLGKVSPNNLSIAAAGLNMSPLLATSALGSLTPAGFGPTQDGSLTPLVSVHRGSPTPPSTSKPTIDTDSSGGLSPSGVQEKAQRRHSAPPSNNNIGAPEQDAQLKNAPSSPKSVVQQTVKRIMTTVLPCLHQSKVNCSLPLPPDLTPTFANDLVRYNYRLEVEFLCCAADDGKILLDLAHDTRESLKYHEGASSSEGSAFVILNGPLTDKHMMRAVWSAELLIIAADQKMLRDAPDAHMKPSQSYTSAQLARRNLCLPSARSTQEVADK